MQAIMIEKVIGKNTNLPRIARIFFLDQESDAYFDELISQVDAALTQVKSLKILFEEIRKEFESNFYGYLDRNINKPPGRDYFINNLHILVTGRYLNLGDLLGIQYFWSSIEDMVRRWEDTRNKRFHKGSIYFFASYPAFYLEQIDKAFFLLHKAYEEDVKTQGTPTPDTPAFKTVSINEDKGNALYGIVVNWANYLIELIDNYSLITNRKFSLYIFRDKFLKTPPSLDILFSFTHTLVKFHYFDLTKDFSSQGVFPNLYKLNMLFDLVLVLDRKILFHVPEQEKNKKKYFIELGPFLLNQASLISDSNRYKTELVDLNDAIRKSSITFDKKVKDLLDHNYFYADGTKFSRLECDIALAYIIRNHSAHNIDSFPVIGERFIDIRQSIFNGLFLAVETLQPINS
ncbi:MAG TPA: hypothetical protein PKD23_06770 [Bellilinea sp.]|nr:hypothetical protein [Bellilinea sp.]